MMSEYEKQYADLHVCGMCGERFAYGKGWTILISTGLLEMAGFDPLARFPICSRECATERLLIISRRATLQLGYAMIGSRWQPPPDPEPMSVSVFCRSQPDSGPPDYYRFQGVLRPAAAEDMPPFWTRKIRNHR
jgi:hypothetical protein